jgi:hypothetical protein
MTKGAQWTPFIDPPKEGEVSLVVPLSLHTPAKVLIRLDRQRAEHGVYRPSFEAELG